MQRPVRTASSRALQAVLRLFECQNLEGVGRLEAGADDTLELDGIDLYAFLRALTEIQILLWFSLDQQHCKGWPEICRSMEVCLAEYDCIQQLVPACRTQRIQRTLSA